MNSRSRFIGNLLICWLWMAGAAMSRGAWLEWEANTDSVDGYRVHVGTNSRIYTFTSDVGKTNRWFISRLAIPLGRTNYFGVTAYNIKRENRVSEEAFMNWMLLATQPITNVALRVPSGKFYVERADTASAWLAMNVVNGPTNISFPTAGVMGFYRYRPYFVSFANPKGGSAKLMAAKKPVFKKKPAKVFEPQPARITPINLDPSRR